MMQQDEQKALAVTRHYLTVLNKSVKINHGKLLNDYGDGSLCTFPSVIDALHCAIEVQQQLQTEPKVPLRIGLHSGEVFFEGYKVMGDSVNVASRIQSLGQGNTILFSKEIFDKIKNQSEFKSISLGRFEFKNVDEPMEIFALANDGLKVPKREDMRGKLKEIQKKTSRRKWVITTAIIALIISAFFIYKSHYSTQEFTGEKSIAVLPFENNGTDNSEEYINDGITQDIINNLSKIASLKKVIGWFSVKGFKKTAKSLNQIAEELGVAAILTGTIQRQAGNIHIIAELIDVNTNKRLWGDEFNYDSKDLLSIQTTVSAEIVRALKANLTPEEEKGLYKHYTENIEAYKFYRKGRAFWDQRTRANYDSAIVYYNKALQLDPEYALAYAGLADCYSLPYNGLPQLEGMPIARTYASKALSLDSTLSEAWTTLGFVQSAFDYDWATSKKTLQKAIELNPNYAIAHVYYGNLLQYTHENTRAGINEIKKALDIEPLSASINWVLGRNYFYAHQNDSAYEQLRKAITLFPNYPLYKIQLVYILLQRKKYSDAIELCNKYSDKWTNILLAYSYAIMGDSTRAVSKLEKILKIYPKADSYDYLYGVAGIYTALNNFDQAITTLEKAYNAREIDMYFINNDPVFDPLRNEPRFKALMKKINF